MLTTKPARSSTKTYKNDPMARRVVSHGKWTGIWQPTFHVASAGEESEKNTNGQVVKDIRMSVVEIFPGF